MEPVAKPLLPFPLILATSIVWVLTTTDTSAFGQRNDPIVAGVAVSVCLNVLAAVVALRAGAVTRSGAVAGAVTGTVLLAAGGWPAWSILGGSLVLAMTSTRWRRARKMRRGIAEARGGRRAAANVLANTGLGAALAVVAWSRPGEALWPLALTAALAAAASDTVASEMGKAVGGRTWRLLPPVPVAPGDIGGVSLAGLGGSAAASIVFGCVALATGLAASWVHAAIVVVAAFGAGLLEGVLAVVTEERGLLDNDGVNVLTGAIGAGLAALMLKVL